MNESRVKSCLAKFYSGSYSRLYSCVPLVIPWALTRLRCSLRTSTVTTTREMTAATPTTTSMAPHTAPDAAADTTCEVCFVAPREGFALVPCGHAPFCESYANRVTVMDTFPVCRSNIIMVMRIFK